MSTKKPTDRQVEIAKLHAAGMSQRRIAKKLGVDRSSVCDSLRAAKRHGLIAESIAAPPEGYLIKGTSTLYGPEGDIKAQWVKTTADQEAQRA